VRLYGLYTATGNIVPGFYVSGVTSNCPISTANGVIYTAWVSAYMTNADNGVFLGETESISSFGGGVDVTYDMPSVTIGDNEIVLVSGLANGIAVYEMPSPTITPTITGTPPTQTITQTPTITETPEDIATPTATPKATEGAFYLKLVGNYPNPFKDETYIIYELGRTSDININIYTISGELAAALQETGYAGINSIRWDGRTKSQRETSSGIYVFIIEATSGSDKARIHSKCAVVK